MIWDEKMSWSNAGLRLFAVSSPATPVLCVFCGQDCRVFWSKTCFSCIFYNLAVSSGITRISSKALVSQARIFLASNQRRGQSFNMFTPLMHHYCHHTSNNWGCHVFLYPVLTVSALFLGLLCYVYSVFSYMIALRTVYLAWWRLLQFADENV